MRVKVKLYGHLRKFVAKLQEANGNTGWVELNDEATVMDIYTAIGLNFDEVMVVDINGKIVGKEAKLRTGDLVSFFPTVGGG
ncbi:MoaD/ThiS family protein [Calderihabitans maritimus]|uniref:Molybdopterin converting factor, subunit 1 n=1 Tax=Calderihabitans maritimus TaxID=1246530 RepID=A0A1Z5HTE8_9FIRM|nr:MoaD/ThiS family protein [Calderihabitans maritimus]GAW92802.1 Molybdopterin converting factor, subunit 1 [Calderihabitans maritimus]